MVSFRIEDGYLFVAEQCESKHTIQWLIGLLIHTLVLSVVLIIFAILTRKVDIKDFKDTKKVSVLSFLVVITTACTLFYWYFLRIIKADVILIQGVLQFGHCSFILECQGLIFAPKLFPIIKDRLRHRLSKRMSAPAPPMATPDTDVSVF